MKTIVTLHYTSRLKNSDQTGFLLCAQCSYCNSIDPFFPIMRILCLSSSIARHRIMPRELLNKGYKKELNIPSDSKPSLLVIIASINRNQTAKKYGSTKTPFKLLF